MTEKEKMLASELYDPSDAELVRLRQTAHSLCRQYNNLDETDNERESILDKLFVKREPGVYLQGPIFFDYGVNTQIGENTYANFNFTVLDCAPVTIGKNVFFGPNVAIYTPLHPLRWQERNMSRSPTEHLQTTNTRSPSPSGITAGLQATSPSARALPSAKGASSGRAAS